MSHHVIESLADNRPVGDGVPPELERVRNTSLLVGVVGLALWLLSLLGNRDHAFRSYLFAYVFWIAIPLGSMVFVAMGNLTGGEYAVINRRFAEAAMCTLPVMFLLSIPMFFGLGRLFPWTHIGQYQDQNIDFVKVMVHRSGWYNQPVFIVRQVVYFAIWMAFAFALRNRSLRLDREENPLLRHRISMISAPAILVYFITITSWAMDFILSRETNFYSSIIGFLTAVGQAGTAMAFITLMVCFFANRRPIRSVLRPQHLNDDGNLLLALVILWAYMSFAQLLVIWQGDLKEDVGYYTHRGMGPVPNAWRYTALALIIIHFFLPFMLLLMKGLKRKIPTLIAICWILLVARVLDALWVTAPSGPHRAADGQVYWTDIVTFVGFGGIFLATYFWNLARHPLLPQNAFDMPPLLPETGGAGVHGAVAHSLGGVNPGGVAHA